ncbi:glutamate--tRNA ligase [Candidatus Saccharibacteria bacterium]|nr:glutamate--tRNA ligase [Candidatus Saccharibacteria bacterium]
MKTRTRFAPSPTGQLHIGGVRTALFAYLIAKRNKGDFLLRIEDTDKKREVKGADQVIFDTLSWLDLQWDNQEVVYQSARIDRYNAWAKKLVTAGLAYADPYTAEEITAMRAESEAAGKPFLYREHRPEKLEKWQPGEGKSLRFKQTNLHRVHWHDDVRGDLSAGPENLDDFVLIKADGLPTYNFAHIVDDYEMKISHIVRGQEFISSTPNFIRLYEALKITPPRFVTVPSILGLTGGKKLSKRDGAKSVEDYRNDGYLKEAILNFLVLLGWNDNSTDEIFSLAELTDIFDITRIQKASARFDEKRLLWINGQWIRKLPLDELYKRTEGFWPTEAQDEITKKRVLEIMRERLKTLADLRETTYFFKDPTPDLSMITSNKFLKDLGPARIRELLQTTHTTLAEITDWNADNLRTTLNLLLETTGEKPATLFSLIRLSVSFAPFSPELPFTLDVLGRDTTLRRLQSVINMVK